MTRLSRIITLALALLITVTSQQMAMARGTMKDASGQVILCTGQGPVTVTLDTQGNPMGVVHICPDCVLTLADTIIPQNAMQPIVVHMQILAQTPLCDLQNSLIHTETNARGPPLSA